MQLLHVEVLPNKKNRNFIRVIKAFMLTDAQINRIFKELSFQTSRSGGKGGQNVNKVESKVALEFNVAASRALSPPQKQTVFQKYPALIDDTYIRLVSELYRTQLENKEAVKEKLIALLNKLLKPVKKRIATRPSKSSKRKKAESKKKHSEKKSMRRKVV
jgi:ribosome-associated protein